jgi:hypothetical protein
MQTGAFSTYPLANAARSLKSLSSGPRHGASALRKTVDWSLLAVVDMRNRRVRSAQPLGLLLDTLTASRTVISRLDQPEDYVRRYCQAFADESLDRLCWLMGERLARETGLAPWLDATAGFRLLHWPDFGEIGADPQGAGLCTLISTRALDVATIAQKLELPQELVQCAINALSLCGALVSEPVRAGTRSSLRRIGAVAPRQTSLFERLRLQLG